MNLVFTKGGVDYPTNTRKEVRQLLGIGGGSITHEFYDEQGQLVSRGRNAEEMSESEPLIKSLREGQEKLAKSFSAELATDSAKLEVVGLKLQEVIAYLNSLMERGILPDNAQ